jgi:RNA polymerase-binding transcription factor DksA
MSDLDDEGRRALRLTRINQKGLEVATRLAALKAGQNITLADMMVPGLDIDAITKEARVRAFLDLINASRTRLGTDAYGRCLACECPLDALALDETPWLERCADCAADKAPLA